MKILISGLALAMMACVAGHAQMGVPRKFLCFYQEVKGTRRAAEFMLDETKQTAVFNSPASLQGSSGVAVFEGDVVRWTTAGKAPSETLVRTFNRKTKAYVETVGTTPATKTAEGECLPVYVPPPPPPYIPPVLMNCTLEFSRNFILTLDAAKKTVSRTFEGESARVTDGADINDERAQWMESPVDSLVFQLDRKTRTLTEQFEMQGQFLERKGKCEQIDHKVALP